MGHLARQKFAANQDVVLKSNLIGEFRDGCKLHLHLQPAIVCFAELLRARVGVIGRQNQVALNLAELNFTRTVFAPGLSRPERTKESLGQVSSAWRLSFEANLKKKASV
jgi:hypothetical protein